MNRARVVLAARMALYVGAALLAVSFVVAVRLFTGELAGARWGAASFSLAAVAVLVMLPAGYALAMAKA